MEDKDYVVYTHNDKEGNVRYVGSGRLQRANTRYANSSRGAKYRDWVNLHGKMSVAIIDSGLSKEEAISLETQLFNKYFESGLLLNISRPARTKTLPNIEILKTMFYYDETSPSGLRWNRDGKSSKYGEVAGGINLQGYYQVYIAKKIFLTHRIVLGLHDIPIDGFVIDHIDGNRSNNSLNNLRAVSHADNARNRKTMKSGGLPIGVRHDLKRGMLVASVTDISRKTPSGYISNISRHFLIDKYGY